ncbi:MAG: glycosyltransferase family 4 protein, partial [Anaerolineae bacterium]|nr:glycosyltransferase family 4 protein [Anaerolineae bacterium]
MPGVVLVRSSRFLGGIERQLLDHARRLREAGWHPHLVCLLRGAGEHPLVTAARAEGLPAVTVPDPGPLALRVWRDLAAILERTAGALIHTCDYRSDILVGARLRGKRPWLAESHGHTVAGPWVALANRADVRVLRWAAAVVAVSVAWETALAAAGVPARRLHVIGNSTAILPTTPPPPPMELPSGRHLLFAGRHTPDKGLDLLLRAWPQVRGPHPNLHLWVLGEPTGKGWESRLAAQEGVHCVGWQPDIRPWLVAVDAVVVPSRREAWGMTAFEALATGVPVVATRVGGLPTLCAGAPHAVLVTPEQPEALAAGILTVLRPDFPRGPALGVEFRCRPAFDPARRFDRFLALYDALG